MQTGSAVDRLFARQYGVGGRRQALAAGLTRWQIDRLISSGRWVRIHPGVYRLAGAPWIPEAALLAACLATGGRASHESAGWLWGMLAKPPPRPTVSVRVDGRTGDGSFVAHSVRHLVPERPGTLRRIPCTDALRTVIDLAGVLDGAGLDDAVDRAVARGIVDVGRLEAELRKDGARRRRGVARLRTSLCRRGYIGAPRPSVLESRMRRLLARAGIEPLRCEQRVGPYRLDFTLAERLAVEVDGYAYHANPEVFRRDLRRRNELRAAGWEILVYAWLDVTTDGDRIVGEVRLALARHAGR